MDYDSSVDHTVLAHDFRPRTTLTSRRLRVVVDQVIDRSYMVVVVHFIAFPLAISFSRSR